MGRAVFLQLLEHVEHAEEGSLLPASGLLEDGEGSLLTASRKVDYGGGSLLPASGTLEDGEGILLTASRKVEYEVGSLLPASRTHA